MTTVDHFTLTIPGRPHPWQRARANNGRMFTAPRTRAHSALVQTEWIAAGRPRLALGAYKLTLVAYFARPASHLRKNGLLAAAGRRAPIPTANDVDNLTKQILDSLTACGAIPDDRWCAWIDARKEWCPPDMQEATVVALTSYATGTAAA